MKAYVIKNKEGKYRDKEGWLSNNLLDVDIFKDYELALSACLSDEKPVEITITEGNLEKNQKAIECLKEVKDNFCSARMIFFADCKLSQKEKDLILDHQEEDKRILADLIDNKIKELESEE